MNNSGSYTAGTTGSQNKRSGKMVVIVVSFLAIAIGGLLAGVALVGKTQYNKSLAANCPGGSVGACTNICVSGCGGSDNPTQCVNGCPAACQNLCSGGSGFVCGNGRCDSPGENSTNCSQDCGSGTTATPNAGACPIKTAGSLCNAISCGEPNRCDGAGPLSCIVCPGGTVYSGQNRCSLFNTGAQVAADCGGYVIGQTSACGTGSDTSCTNKSAGNACGSNGTCVKQTNNSCSCQITGNTNLTCNSSSPAVCNGKSVGTACLTSTNTSGVCSQSGTASGSSTSCSCTATIQGGNSQLGCGLPGQPACTCASNQWNVYSCNKCDPSGGCQGTSIGTASNSSVDGMVNGAANCSMRQADCVGSSPLVFKTAINCNASCYATTKPSTSPIATPTNKPNPTSPLPTTTPAPSPTGSTNTIVAQCFAVKVFDTNWGQLTMSELAAKHTGDTVYFTVGGTTTGGSFDRARFTINSTLRGDVSTKRPGTEEFYDAYTIPAGTTTLNVSAQIHHTSLGWN